MRHAFRQNLKLKYSQDIRLLHYEVVLSVSSHLSTCIFAVDYHITCLYLHRLILFSGADSYNRALLWFFLCRVRDIKS